LIWSNYPSPLCCDLVISVLKIKGNPLFHWELVDCKLLHGQWLWAQVCSVANIHRVDICCIGNERTNADFMSDKLYSHPSSCSSRRWGHHFISYGELSWDEDNVVASQHQQRPWGRGHPGIVASSPRRRCTKSIWFGLVFRFPHRFCLWKTGG
jgi:hypothetical protein